MEISVKSEGRCMEIYLKGELDHHGAKGMMMRLDRELELALPLQLVLDFGGVAFMDSSGIAVVMRARNRMQQLGGRLKLRGTASQVRKVFEAAGISRLVEME
jgi:stage II sporulation protein AA (anti-sigma F factor antagonist)